MNAKEAGPLGAAPEISVEKAASDGRVGAKNVNAKDAGPLGSGFGDSSKPTLRRSDRARNTTTGQGSSGGSAAGATAVTHKGGKRKSGTVTKSDRSAKFNKEPSEGSSSDDIVEREEEESGANEEEGEAGASKKRKSGPAQPLPKPKKHKLLNTNTELDGTLADVEALPPKVSPDKPNCLVGIKFKPDIDPNCIAVGIQTRRVKA